MATKPAPKKPSKMYRVGFPVLLMALPTAGVIFSVLAYALINFLSSAWTQPQNGELFAQPNPIVIVTNVVLFIIGALSFMTGLPCFILGLILFIQRNSNSAKN